MYKSLVLELQLTLDKYKDYVDYYMPTRYISNLKDFIYCLVNSIQHSDNNNEWADTILLTKVTPQTLTLQKYLYDYFGYDQTTSPGLFTIVNLDETKYLRKFLYHSEELNPKPIYKLSEISDILKPFTMSKLSEKNIYAEYYVFVDENNYGYNIDLIKLKSLLEKYKVMSTKFEIITI